MKAFKTALVVLACVSGSTAQVLADMGQVWPVSVTPSSISIDWEEPDGIYDFASSLPQYRLSVQRVDVYGNGYPTPSLSSLYLTGADPRPYKVDGLEPGQYYRFIVEALTVKNFAGVRVNPEYREVGSFKQKTLDPNDPRLLRISGTGPREITVSFSAPVIEGIQVVRIGYFQKWRSQEFSATLRNPAVPAWGSSDAVRGWVDVLANYPVEVTFKDLLPGQAYEIQVYGHRIDTDEGIRLGRATAKTGGHRALSTVEACLAAHFPEILASYGRRLRDEHGQSVFSTVAELFPELNELRPQLEDDEAEDLSNDLTALLYLIDAQHEEFLYWQLREEEGGLTLARHLDQFNPDLAAGMARELDPSPAVFVRGDASPDGIVDMSDAIAILAHLFLGKGEIRCRDAADANDDEAVDMSDAVFVLGFLFNGTQRPNAPFPEPGSDPTGDGASGCEEYAAS